MTLVFATHNKHKLDEVRSLLPASLHLITLDEAGVLEEIPEPFNSLEENASVKSYTVYQRTGFNCFSEDTGLEVEALGGAPGAKSARYAGEKATSDSNIALLLSNLATEKNRNARFRTVISLRFEDQEFLFEGLCPGRILTEKKGSSGFGYDPVFVPNGSGQTFAEMTMAEKNIFSHRQKAMTQLVRFLNNRMKSKTN